jgi:hypothetical protein
MLKFRRSFCGNEMTLSRDTQDLARRLLDYEAAAGDASGSTDAVIVRVCDKLRRPLSAIMGVADYRVLLSRALTLAKMEAPTLGVVKVTADGSLQGLGEISPQAEENRTGEAGVVLIAQLLGLFLAFLGEALTLQLVRDVSPHLEVATESGATIPFEEINQEVVQLNHVSGRLESLACQHPLVDDALMSISGNIRNTATTLEVLALIRSKSKGLEKKVLKQHSKRKFGLYLM